MILMRAWYPIVLFVIVPGLSHSPAHAGVITSVDIAKANANDGLRFNSDFGLTTGTVMTPVTAFMFGGKNYTGRIVTPKDGAPIVVYDLTTLSIDAGKTLTIEGSLPIGFITLDAPATEFDISIEGILSLSAEGQKPGAGGGAGGNAANAGGKATGAAGGSGETGTGTGGGAGGGGGYGGKGGQGAVGGVGQGNRTGGLGGDTYGTPDLKVLFGGGGGAGAKVPQGERATVGGGGGGGVFLSTKGKIRVSGRVEADGARGGDTPGPGLGGGGGAGGGILLEALDGVCKADTVVISGRISARGGSGGSDGVRASGGGGGGGGRVFVSDCFADLTRVNVRGGSGGFTTFDEPMELQGKAGENGTLQTPPKPVPAPSSLVLIVSGLAGMIGMSTRTHRRGRCAIDRETVLQEH